jgi:hypothetical protein
MLSKVERSEPSAMVERVWVGGVVDCFGQRFGVGLRLGGDVGWFVLVA